MIAKPCNFLTFNHTIFVNAIGKVQRLLWIMYMLIFQAGEGGGRLSIWATRESTCSKCKWSINFNLHNYHPHLHHWSCPNNYTSLSSVRTIEDTLSWALKFWYAYNLNSKNQGIQIVISNFLKNCFANLWKFLKTNVVSNKDAKFDGE